MRKMWEKIRAPFSWDEIGFAPGWRFDRPVIVQRNTITEATRWCYVTPPRGIPDDWKAGLPKEADVRLTPPSGGSGVNRPSADRAADLIERIREALPEGLRDKLDEPPITDRFANIRKAMQEANISGKLLLEPGEPVAPKPRRLQLSAAPKGGYMVGEPYEAMGRPFFKTVFAGDLSDCLNFMETEMEAPSC